MTITAANETRHAVVVESVGFDLSNSQQLVFPSSPVYPLPYEVRPGGKYEAWAFVSMVNQQVASQGQQAYITRIWANDAVGKRWRRKVSRDWTMALRNIQERSAQDVER